MLNIDAGNTEELYSINILSENGSIIKAMNVHKKNPANKCK